MEILENPDPFDLARFIRAQQPVYETVLAELRQGEKRTHWIWFIFPQIDGLGFSATAQFYAIKNPAEAQAYLDHPLLGKRLLECCDLVLAIQDLSINEIFGYPDDLKFRSCLTLFSQIPRSAPIFNLILQKHFRGQADTRTLEILNQMRAG